MNIKRHINHNIIHNSEGGTNSSESSSRDDKNNSTSQLGRRRILKKRTLKSQFSVEKAEDVIYFTSKPFLACNRWQILSSFHCCNMESYWFRTKWRNWDFFLIHRNFVYEKWASPNWDKTGSYQTTSGWYINDISKDITNIYRCVHKMMCSVFHESLVR